ncbi:MAG: hypothetical protein IJT87_07885 [Ruminiclostridium sp.]|nr:hypothetical protein [Ruminiclostridium sp.]
MTLEGLYNKVMSSRDIMAEFVKASGTDTLSEFAERHGCTATDIEIRRFFIAKCEGEIPDEELEIAAGGAVDFAKLFDRIHNVGFNK